MRVAMLSLRNLLSNTKLELGPEMVESGLSKVVQQRLSQVRFCLLTAQNHSRHSPTQVICVFDTLGLAWLVLPVMS